MKTLSDLKREANNYTWEMYYNSWFGGYLQPGHKFYGKQRKVLKVQSNSLCFEIEGQKTGSWLDWPKARELTITDKVFAGGQEKTAGHGEYIICINPADERECTIYYHLRPVSILAEVR